jgi:ribonuclease HII
VKGIKYIVGIDEAGRGPLAGPIYFGGVLLKVKDSILKKRIKDSKQQSPQKREELFLFLQNEKKLGRLNFVTVSFSSKQIDSLGLSQIIKKAIEQILIRLKANPKQTEILLDGGLKAPIKYKFQKTIIKGDEKRSIIALASIAAKVSRDKRMIFLSKKHPKYKFHIHKGYGTAMHIKLIELHGPSLVHRITFLKNIVIKKRNKRGKL